MSKKVIITDTDFGSIDLEKIALKDIAEVILADTKRVEELINIVADADGLIVQYAPINEVVINNMKKCKVISRYGVGFNNVDVQAASKRGIYVCNVTNYCSNEVADHVMAMLLALHRKLFKLNNSVRNNEWDIRIAKPILSLNETTLGIVGLGNIGRNLARKARAFNINIIAYDPYIEEKDLTENWISLCGFQELIKKSDFISLNLSLTNDTKHMFSREEFKKMKSTAIIINTARGGLIDFDALLEALESGQIAGAGIDVLEKEPPELDKIFCANNLIITPHGAFYSENSIKTLRTEAAKNIARILKGEKAINVVNDKLDLKC